MRSRSAPQGLQKRTLPRAPRSSKPEISSVLLGAFMGDVHQRYPGRRKYCKPNLLATRGRRVCGQRGRRPLGSRFPRGALKQSSVRGCRGRYGSGGEGHAAVGPAAAGEQGNGSSKLYKYSKPVMRNASSDQNMRLYMNVSKLYKWLRRITINWVIFQDDWQGRWDGTAVGMRTSQGGVAALKGLHW